MRPEVRAEMDEWMARARMDLHAVTVLLDATPPLTAPAVFHAQQAAEKALKGFLAAHDQIIPRTHELPALLDQCKAIDPSMQQLVVSAQELNPYTARFRYPGSAQALEPDEPTARAALEHATTVFKFIEQRLPQ